MIGASEVMEAVKQSDHYRSELQGEHRGRGVSLGFWFNGGNESSAYANVNADGTVSLVLGSVDIGGQRAALAMTHAESLGIAYEDVKPSVVDTDSVGWTGTTGGSRTTFASGWAAHEAALDIRDQLEVRAAQIWEVDREQVHYGDDAVIRGPTGDDGNERTFSFKEIAAQLPGSGGMIQGHANVKPTTVGPAFAANIVDVEVDPETGKVDVLRYTAIQDVGDRHPPLVRRRPDPGRRRPGRRHGAHRGVRLRRERPHGELEPARLSHADSARPADDRDCARRGAESPGTPTACAASARCRSSRRWPPSRTPSRTRSTCACAGCPPRRPRSSTSSTPTRRSEHRRDAAAVPAPMPALMYLNEFASGLDALDLSASPELRSLLESAADLGIPHSPELRYRSRNTVLRHQRFHFLEWGEPDAPSLLLLHGGNQTAHSWDLVSLHLADRYHVLAIDQRGHGDSEWARDADYSATAMAEDALAFIDQLRLERPLIMGHSMGGMVAMTLLAQRPEGPRAAVSVDVGPEVSGEGAEVIRAFVQRNVEFDDLDEFVERVTAYDPYRTREHVTHRALQPAAPRRRQVHLEVRPRPPRSAVPPHRRARRAHRRHARPRGRARSICRAGRARRRLERAHRRGRRALRRGVAAGPAGHRAGLRPQRA